MAGSCLYSNRNKNNWTNQDKNVIQAVSEAGIENVCVPTAAR